MHNTSNSFQHYWFQPTSRPDTLLGIYVKPCISIYINWGKRSHSLKTSITKLVKNSVKLDEESNCILKNKNVLNKGLIKKVGTVKFFVVFGAHCSFCFYNLKIGNVCTDDPVLQGILICFNLGTPRFPVVMCFKLTAFFIKSLFKTVLFF